MLMCRLLFGYCFVGFSSRYMPVRLLISNFTENGYKKVQFHILGDISNYTPAQIGIIKETVSAIVGCDNEEIHLNGVCRSTSFFVVLSMKERLVDGLFNMKQQDKEKLISLNINYFIVGSDHIYLKTPKGSFCNLT